MTRQQFIQLFQASKVKALSLPLFISKISAGFPSPADDYIDRKLDLNEHLIKNPSSTFFVRVTGDSMEQAGIFDGDLLIIDRAKEPAHNSIILAIVNGEFTVKRYLLRQSQIILAPENPKYQPIIIQDGMDFEVWGVAVNVIHSLK